MFDRSQGFQTLIHILQLTDKQNLFFFQASCKQCHRTGRKLSFS